VRILITAGPTHEPIDPVRYIGNRSSGKMGSTLAAAALDAGHSVTLILGPVHIPFPTNCRRIDVETAAQMHEAVVREFPAHDLLIMAAAVADYRPKAVSSEKLDRHSALVIETESTPDIIQAVSRTKRPDQRTVAFSLETAGNIERARQKMIRKHVDLMVFNPIQTMNSPSIQPVLLQPDGSEEAVPAMSKQEFALLLIARVVSLLPGKRNGGTTDEHR
jgi:phosphopantothenoylcysteine decarboxylase/phosphopantothenate--cysteine ligase